MKRSARVSSQFSEPLHRQLNAYALAASAAGVGMLALVQHAEAKIVYTSAYVKIGVGGVRAYRLDINHDGIYDFVLSTFGFDTYGLAVCAPASGACIGGGGNPVNEIWGYNSDKNYGFASALRRGVRIAANRRHFRSRNLVMASVNCGGTGHTCGSPDGPWVKANGNNRYLGLKFIIKGKIHYGWARLDVVAPPPQTRATLIDYAYETIPNKPIIAGKTHGRDGATLGRLAQGASGVSNRRKP